MTELEDAAHSYLSAGLSVIALTGKAPNSMFHPEGLNTPLRGIPENADDDALIRRLFDHPTTSGIGIPIPPGMVVVDIDGEEGGELYREIIGDDAALVPDTPVATTGRGLHIWFASPKPHRSARLGTKLDLKGHGGYVVAPPSRHPEGGKYRWIDPLVDEESGQRVNVDWLPDSIEERLADVALVADYESPWTLEFDPATSSRYRLMRKTFDLEELKRRIIEAPDGDQNNQIARAALIARDEGVPFETAMEELLEAAVEGHHPVVRARSTIRGAYKRAKRH